MRFSLRSKVSIVFSAIAIVALVAGFLFMFIGAGASTHTAKANGLSYSQLSKIQQRLLDGFAALELNPNNALTRKPNAKGFSLSQADSCPLRHGDNIKVNQNCLNITDADLQGRGQAENETSIAQDPNHPGHILASSNDYRRGDGNCYGSFSLDGGQSWADTTIPMGFTRGTAFGGVAREYWEAGGDTAVAWDTKGNAYFQCMVFERGQPTTNNPDLSSAVYIFRSTGNNGASWNFPGRPVVENNDVAGSGTVLEDKPYMTVDNHVGSPFQDRIYVTWTEFAADGSAYIWESHSNDYGEHFSPRVLVSGNSSLCVNTFGAGTPNGNCNENQFSQPFTGPDGALYVVFNNFNNALTGPNDNHNQILLAKSTDGGATFSAPVKVSDYYDLPDCATYQNGQDPGRACVPEKGSNTNSVFRATNYASGAVSPANPSQVVVTLGSYINVHSNESNGCAPAGLAANGDNLYTGVKTPGACNNDILLSVSNDGGSTFTGTTTDPRQLASITTGKSQTTTDQWWQWAAFTKSGKLAVSYFDRQYGNDETTGTSDISLSGSDKQLSGFNSVRVTSSSMPLPTQFPDAQGNSVFYGDYSGLSVVDSTAHPLWMDTRDEDLFLCPGTGVPGVPPANCTGVEPDGLQANDQNIYTNAVSVP